MQIPLQISFENSEPSEAVRDLLGHDPTREGHMTIRIPRQEFIVALGCAAAWMLALVTTSQIASSSLASFFWRLT
jgi:hypothetical protein